MEYLTQIFSIGLVSMVMGMVLKEAGRTEQAELLKMVAGIVSLVIFLALVKNLIGDLLFFVGGIR